MTKFLVSILLIILGLTLGQILKTVAQKSSGMASLLSVWIRRLQALKDFTASLGVHC